MEVSINNIHSFSFGPAGAITGAVKDSIRDSLTAAWDSIVSNASDLFAYLGEQLKDGVTSLMKELIDLILTTPHVADNPVIFKMWVIVKTISFCLIGLMFVWEGFKKVTSQGSVGRAVEFKDMFVRMVYGLILATFSLDIVDIIIDFNNALVETMRDNFSMTIDSTLNTTSVWNFIITLALVVVQIVLSIKVAIQYFMRQAEIWLMAVLGPIVYTLWISPNFSGYLGSWMRRLFTTVFTSFFWSLILVLYTAMVGTVALTGTVWGMCMSIALLLVMLETPTYIRQFMDAGSNPIQMLNKAKNTAAQKMRQVRNVASGGIGMAREVTGWLKPKVR